MNLKELARKLDLSPTTVSRALNGYPEVNEATRERVAAAARRYNYKPNTRAIRLATGRAMAVGHVIPLATRHEIVNPVFADVIAGAMGKKYRITQMSIHTNSRGPQPLYRAANKAMLMEAASAPMPVEGGESAINATVTGQIELESAQP